MDASSSSAPPFLPPKSLLQSPAAAPLPPTVTPPTPPPPAIQDTTLTMSTGYPPPPIPDTTLTLSLAPRPPPSPKSAPQPRPAPITVGPPPPCTQCEKQFPTAQALYGHMRCHPERPWRGITPPAECDALRKQFPAEAVGAADKLVLMFSDQPSSAMLIGGTNKAAKRSPFHSPQAATGDADVHKCAAPSPPPATPPPPPPPQVIVHDTTLKLTLAHPPPSPKTLSDSPRRFPRAPRPAPAPAGPPPPCIECGKQFRTAKALHGHMRTHPGRPYRGITPPQQCADYDAFRKQFAATELEVADILFLFSSGTQIGTTTAAKKSGLDSPAASSAAAKGDTTVYRCSVCGKEFATGRALGGHKRLHWEGAAAAAAGALDLSLAPPGQ